MAVAAAMQPQIFGLESLVFAIGNGYTMISGIDAIKVRCVQGITLALRRQPCASFLTSSTVGSRCILYLARACHLSY